MGTDNQGIQGGTEQIHPRSAGIDVNCDIYQPINPGAYNLGGKPVFDFGQEWVAKVQPTAKGLFAAYKGNPYAVAKETYQLKAGAVNGVWGGTTISGRVATTIRVDDNKTGVPSVRSWRLIPVVGCSFRVIGDKPKLSIVRTVPLTVDSVPLETSFSLSHGRLVVVPITSDNFTLVGAAIRAVEIPANATHAKIVGFGSFGDFFFRDPAGNDFMVGLGAVIGMHQRFALHPLALMLIVVSTGPLDFMVEFDTLE